MNMNEPKKHLVWGFAAFTALLVSGVTLPLNEAMAQANVPEAAPEGVGDDGDDDDDDKPKSYPYLKGEIGIEIQSDHTFKADDKDNEVNDTYNTTEAELGFYFNKNFSIQAGLVFEPVEDIDAGDERYFENQGLFAEQLYAQFDFEPFKIFAGKYNVNYGKAWDVAPGVYGTDFAEDGYEFTERLGFGASVTKDAGRVGEVTVTAGVFKQDISTLSNSAFNNRGQTDIDDGGFGNTEDLENFNIAIDGEKIPSLPGLSYHFGYIHQAKGRDSGIAGFDALDDQNGFVFGLVGEREYNSVKFEWLAEVTYFDNFILEDETALKDIAFYTVGGKVTMNKFNVAAVYTYRPAELIGGGDFEDHQLALSTGYEIRDGLTLDLGYKYHVEEDEDNHTVGLLLTKEIEFNTGESAPLK